MSKLGKVAVAMSGGVDSSVAACLLLRQGYEVIGLTMQIWPGELGGAQTKKGEPSLKYIQDAKAIAKRFSIPFYILNLVQDFEEEIIKYFCLEYAEGRTPNPCIVCNRKIKFGSLLTRAIHLGADLLSTGHYARVVYDKGRSRFLLKEALDKDKDQSYVLFSLTQEQLSRIVLPMGEFTKKQTRQKAFEFGLEVNDKPDSQDICFIQDKDYSRYLKEKIFSWPDDSIRKKMLSSMKPGPIVDRKGRILGQHRGVAFYTVGQRQGLRIAKGQPIYVVEIDSENNRIVVGTRSQLERSALVADKLNWISVKRPKRTLEVKAKIRYKHPKADATVHPLQDGTVRVEFKSPQPAITPGQAVVFYWRDEVVGGGWIKEALDR